MRTICIILSCAFLCMDLSAQFQKRVLVEEFSSTPCQFCPPRTASLKSWSEESDNHIVIVHHSRSNDNMSNVSPGLELGNDYEVYAQPTVFVNRNNYNPDDQPFYLSVNDELFEKLDAEVMEEAILDISIENVEFDWDSRMVSGNINVVFAEDMEGDFNLGVYVIEDNVTGGSGLPTLQYGDPDATNFTGVAAYDQKCSDGNWVAQNFPDLVYEDLFIKGYPHFNTVRSAFYDTYGITNNIPSSVSAQQIYGISFFYEIPEYFDPTPLGEPVDLKEIKFLAFVSNNASNLRERNIFNSVMIDLADFLLIDTKDVEKEKVKLDIFPNPTSQTASLSMEFERDVSFNYTILTLDGKALFQSENLNAKQGKNLFPLNIDPIQNSGTYFVRLNLDNTIIIKTLEIIK